MFTVLKQCVKSSQSFEPEASIMFGLFVHPYCHPCTSYRVVGRICVANLANG